MIKYITANEQVTSVWSGGTTTQLFIYPTESNFAERNFSLRISTATVDVEESRFTALPNYHRVLMILNGELEITHENQYTKILKPFEQDQFLGSWVTHAKGKVVDFNVIHKPELQVTVQELSLHATQRHKLNAINNTFIYTVNGSFGVDNLSNQFINQGEAVLVEHDEAFFITAQNNCNLIIVSLPTLA